MGLRGCFWQTRASFLAQPENGVLDSPCKAWLVRKAKGAGIWAAQGRSARELLGRDIAPSRSSGARKLLQERGVGRQPRRNLCPDCHVVVRMASKTGRCIRGTRDLVNSLADALPCQDTTSCCARFREADW